MRQLTATGADGTLFADEPLGVGEPLSDRETPYADPEHRSFRFAAGSDQALLIPGFMGTPRELRPLGRALANAGVTATGILLPGFGPDGGRLRDVGETDWVATAMAAWDEVTAAAGDAPAILVGFSMGGAVALKVTAAAARPPDRLVLLAPHWRFADRRAIALPLLKYVIREFRPHAAADFDDPRLRHEFTQSHPGADLDDKAVRERLRRETALPTATLDELRKVSNAGGRAAARVRVPTLVIQGRDDTTVLPDDTKNLVRRLAGPSELLDVAGGHMLVSPDEPGWPEMRDAVVSFATGGERA